MLHSDIQLDVGGTLTLYPTETGRPSSATVTLVSASGASLATPSVTIDAVNTTVSTNASEGAESLTLTSASGVTARRHYVVVCDDGERLTVRVRAIRGSVVDLYSPLPRDVDSTSTFYGTMMTAPVTAGVATPIAAGLEARWIFTTDSIVRRVNTRWSVVRSVWPELLGTVAGLREAHGRLLTPEREANHQRGAGYSDEIARASRNVRLDLIQRNRHPSRFRSFSAWDDVVYQRVVLDLSEDGYVMPEAYANNPSDWVQLCRERYERMVTQALAATEDYDESEDGTVSTTEAETTSHYARLTR